MAHRDENEIVTCSSGGVLLETLATGARVRRLRVEAGTGPREVVLGHREVAEYAAAGDHMGATVGRFANRIAAARLELGGRSYPLSANENGNTLHGGREGFGSRVWTLVSSTPDRVEYALTSPDGDQGFPGAVHATSVYQVHPDGVELELRATCDAPTVVSLTNHAYFNLAGGGSIDDHVLTVPADSYTPTDDLLIPTGEVAPVAGTALDLRAPTRIGTAVRRPDDDVLTAPRGIDHNLVPRGAGLRVVAVLEVPDLRLTVRSDAPGLQVYTGNFLDGSTRGLDGAPIRQGDGLCLEPQDFPDTPSTPAFGSSELLPGRTWLRRIRWTFEPLVAGAPATAGG
ncbi:aldose epimerase family protein [Kineosporia sp. A_224]|uniref:aldose epimerase family protein n=1 Tax=Kineosporia sp. A_224 TaxID=1962180 RepID=UPI0013042F2F|nr:aldose epimerase family protein [Kineosporia sp. A_224]